MVTLNDTQRDAIHRAIRAHFGTQVDRYLIHLRDPDSASDDGGWYRIGTVTYIGKSKFGHDHIILWAPDRDETRLAKDEDPKQFAHEWASGKEPWLPSSRAEATGSRNAITPETIAATMNDGRRMLEQRLVGPIRAVTGSAMDYARSRDASGLGQIGTFETLAEPRRRWQLLFDVTTGKRLLREVPS